MTVTIRDVAHAAGVSVSTASRALSGNRPVSPELVTRVQRAVRELGYQQNELATALRTQRTKTIGMVVPEISNPFFPAIVEAVERQLQRSGRDLFLSDSQQDTDIELRRVQALIARKVDGIVITPVSAEGSLAALRAAAEQVPVVQVDRYVDGFTADWVGVDGESGITQLVEHIADAGARSCVLVSAGEASSAGRLRLDAFARATRRHELTPEEPLLGEFSLAWGAEAGRKLLEQPSLPDAIVCGNDEIALGLTRELRGAGVSVPSDVMVTGFDDITFATLADPPLTTIRQPRELIAAEAIRLLDRASADGCPSPPQRISLAPELVIRASTTGGQP